MNYKDWFSYYNDPDERTLQKAYAKAFLDGSARDDESFVEWCRAEYKIYREDPKTYEVPYTGLLD
jgi:hypothetical protein